jgi:hypothetical protein
MRSILEGFPVIEAMAQTVLYRVYTEDEPGYRDAAIQALQKHGIQYFTLVPAVGYGPGQGGKQEKTVIIDVATEHSPENEQAIHAAAEDIRRDNNQQSILIVRIPAYPKLVTSEKQGKDVDLTTMYDVLCIAKDMAEVTVGDNGEPVRKRATARGRIVASFGAWKPLLGNTGVAKGRIVRFGVTS